MWCPRSLAYYGHPPNYDYDPAKARPLLKEAGCLPCKVTFGISTSGSGQMQPLPMNELVKAQLEEAGFEVSLQAMDWNTLLDVYRGGVDKNPNYDGLNFSRGLLDPVNAIIKLVGKAYWAPAGSNWGHYENPESERLISEIFNEFDEEKRLSLLTQLHELEGREAVMIFVVHDLNPRALSPKVQGFVQAQSWFQDLTPVSVPPDSRPHWLGACFETLPRSLLSMSGYFMALKNSLILRRPRGGHLEGRTALIQRIARVLALGAGISFADSTAHAGGTLVVGMTAGDLPITTGNPDQGFEGYRFVGYNLYDSLVLWDLSKSDKAADIKPGLATEWQIDEANPKRWIFKLRQGVKWHDGCDFKADDVVWNLSRSTNDKAPEFDPSQFAQARSYLGNFAGVQKIDDYTVAFDTKGPDSLFPYEISYVLLISPCRAKEVNYNWAEFALQALRDRPLPLRPGSAAPAPRIRAEYGVLGQERACRSRTGWCLSRCQKPRRARRPYCPAR